MIKIKGKKNIMDFVPKKNTKYNWEVLADDLVRIIILRNSFFENVVRKFKKLPKTFEVDLDEFGSFVWKCIDGTKTVYEISNQLKDRFGETAEPAYERVSKFMNLLKNNDFIKFVK